MLAKLSAICAFSRRHFVDPYKSFVLCGVSIVEFSVAERPYQYVRNYACFQRQALIDRELERHQFRRIIPPGLFGEAAERRAGAGIRAPTIADIHVALGRQRGMQTREIKAAEHGRRDFAEGKCGIEDGGRDF